MKIMPVVMERTLEFASELPVDFDALGEHVSADLVSLGYTAVAAAQADGERYNWDTSAVAPLDTVPGPDYFDTPVGAGKAVLDLLRSAREFADSGAVLLDRQVDPATGVTTVVTRDFNPTEQRKAAEILGTERYGQPVQSVSFSYTHDMDHGMPTDPTGVSMTAMLGGNPSQPYKFFTNVARDDGRDVHFALSRQQSLSVSAGNIHSSGVRPPYRRPVSFQHVQLWSRLFDELS